MNGVADTCMDGIVLTGAPLAASLEREFEQRLADSSRLAFRVALGVLRHREDAEDVAQEAFVRAYRNFHRLRDRDRFRAWLARITWRLAIDRLRAAGRRARYEESAATERTAAGASESAQPSVEQMEASREFQRRLDAAVDELPEKLRAVVLLAAIEGHDIHEVARLLEIPEGTVKSRLHRARKQLAEKLP